MRSQDIYKGMKQTDPIIVHYIKSNQTSRLVLDMRSCEEQSKVGLIPACGLWEAISYVVLNTVSLLH